MKNKISATGKVTYNEKKLLNIVSRVSGRIEEVFAFMQSKVTVAEPLLSLYSPEYLTTQAEYLQAEERLKRVKQLNNPEEETTAKGIYESARQKLKIIGILEKKLLY